MKLFPMQVLDILTRILDPSKEMKSKVCIYRSLVPRGAQTLSTISLSDYFLSGLFSFIMDQLMGQ